MARAGCSGHSAGVRGALLLADGELLSWAGGFRSTDHTLRLWDLTKRPEPGCSKGTALGSLALCCWPTASASLSWTGEFDSTDHTLRLWDLTSGQSRVLDGHSTGVTGALQLADGERVLSWAGDLRSTDRTLRLWDLKSGQSRVLEGHTDVVTGAAVGRRRARPVLGWGPPVR